MQFCFKQATAHPSLTLRKVLHSTEVVRSASDLRSLHDWMIPNTHYNTPEGVHLVLRLPDHLKFFQGHFVVLWLLKFYFMPT